MSAARCQVIQLSGCICCSGCNCCLLRVVRLSGVTLRNEGSLVVVVVIVLVVVIVVGLSALRCQVVGFGSGLIHDTSYLILDTSYLVLYT